MARTAAETRSQVLGVAEDLFYGQGIRATGVDRVAAEAGVAPTTLYRLFPSKDDLVGAYVERMHHGFQETVAAAVAAAGPDPRDQILAIFDTVYGEVGSEQYRGCALQITLAEFPDAGLPAHRNAVAAKTWLRGTFRELTGRLGVESPDELADDLLLIHEGLHATAQSLGPAGPAGRARHLVAALLPAAAPPSSGS